MMSDAMYDGIQIEKQEIKTRIGGGGGSGEIELAEAVMIKEMAKVAQHLDLG
jgi:hypothetical protein